MNERRIPTTSLAQRGVAALVAGLLVVGTPAVALAAPTPLVTEVSQVPEGEGKELAETGVQYYGQANFAGAGQAFSNALDTLPASKPNMRARMKLAIDAISAFREDAKVKNDLAPYAQGDAVYRKYVAQFQAAYGNPNIPAAVKRAHVALQSDYKRMQSNKNPNPPPDKTGGKSKNKSSTGLYAGGGLLLAAGVGMIGMFAGGAVMGGRAEDDSKNTPSDSPDRGDIEDRGQRANALMITGGVLAPIFIGAGAALIGVGVKRSRGSGKRAMVAPVYDGRTAGFAVAGRF